MASSRDRRKQERAARAARPSYLEEPDETEDESHSVADDFIFNFTTVVARSGRVYRSALFPLAILFGGIALIISLTSFLGLTDIGRIELFAAFLAQIVVPAVAGSWGIALSAIVFAERAAGREATLASAFTALKSVRRDVLLASLIASMMALWAIILLAQFGFILMPLFFGPPFLIQAIALDKLPAKDARVRTRDVLKGYTGRAILYLVVIALAIGLLGGVALQATIAAADAATGGFLLVAIFSVMQIILAALTLPYLAAASYVMYTQLAAMKANDPEA